MKRRALDVFISIALGFVLMAPLGMLFDAMNWGVFHSWGLARGSFIVAWPLLTLVSYHIVQLIRKVIAA